VLRTIQIKIGDDKILQETIGRIKEAESGYLKINWKADEIKKEMGSIPSIIK
jgi:hypothetical protein